MTDHLDFSFSGQLLAWYRIHKRDLPWRHTRDPYVIWITEIIFQQTRIEQGIDYFHRFYQAFPTVYALAEADDDQVMKLWEGLGYYNRARNLLASARRIAFELGGQFPETYSEWLDIKGVGAYTAAIISSICFGEPKAAVDGNVFRVLSRFYGDKTPIDTGTGKAYYQSLAQALICLDQPGDFNEALMDLGATVCKPAHPDCASCPLKTHCEAFAGGSQADYPVKSKKAALKIRHLNYFLISDKTSLILRRRGAGDIWPELFDFPLIEGQQTEDDLMKGVNAMFPLHLKKLTKPVSIVHQLSHQKLIIQIYSIQTDRITLPEGSEYQVIKKAEVKKLAFPKPLISAIYPTN